MIGLFKGPIGVDEFIEEFTQPPDAKDIPPSLPSNLFAGVPLESTGLHEAAMYPPLISALKQLTPGFRWLLSANTSEAHGVRLRPDISFIESGRWPEIDASQRPVAPKKSNKQKNKFTAMAGALAGIVAKLTGHSADPAPEPEPYDWKRCEFPVEVKRSVKYDAFVDDEDDSVEDSLSAKYSRSSRGQLMSYIKEQMSRQHRTSMHTLFIIGDYARLLFFDRSGGVVTKRFNYHEHPEHLVKFFWRYSHMTQAARGWDPSVMPATDEEICLFDKHVAEFVKGCSKARARRSDKDPDRLIYEVFAASLGLKADYPTYKIQVESPDYSGTLVIRRPFFEPFSPVGRATRGYVAYDAENKKVVFLKDTWRTTQHSERMTEPQVYVFLKSEGVTNIPKVLYAADVERPEGGTQRTYTDLFTPKKHPDSGPGGMRGHVHCRIVQELAFPLWCFQDSRELVRVLRDALLAIKCAYDAGILHRDISLGNVMIVPEDGSGILNDWDHSRQLQLPSDLSPETPLIPLFRTGTWQFMSIHILDQPDRRHTVLDDIESVYWLFLYCALHWLPHTVKHNSKFNIQMFDEEQQLETIATGGNLKGRFLTRSHFKDLEFGSKPVNDLLQGLAQQFKAIYWAEDAEEEDIRVRAQAVSEKLTDVTLVLDMFNKALERTDWPENKDRVPDQFPSRTQTQTTREHHKNIIESFGRGTNNDFTALPADSSTQDPPSSSAARSYTRAEGSRSASAPILPNRGHRKRGTDTSSQAGPLYKRALSASTSSSIGSGMMPGGFSSFHVPYTPEFGPVAGPSRVPHSSRGSTSTSIGMTAPSSQGSTPKRKRRGSASISGEGSWLRSDSPSKRLKQ